MLVSIIIPAYNSEKTLAICLAACLNQSGPDTEVIVVDDGSTDGTARIAQTFPVHYIHQENCGPAAARNRGAQAASGGVIAFTDADCVPERVWIDGARMYDANNPRLRPVSDFELGQPGEGDVK